MLFGIGKLSLGIKYFRERYPGGCLVTRLYISLADVYRLVKGLGRFIPRSGMPVCVPKRVIGAGEVVLMAPLFEIVDPSLQISDRIFCFSRMAVDQGCSQVYQDRPDQVRI